jgi:hypothetical protein
MPHLWYYLRYARSADDAGRHHVLRFERLATTNALEQGRRVAALGEDGEPLFWVKGALTADTPDDLAVTELEDALAEGCRRRLLDGTWERGDSYSLREGSQDA